MRTCSKRHALSFADTSWSPLLASTVLVASESHVVAKQWMFQSLLGTEYQHYVTIPSLGSEVYKSGLCSGRTFPLMKFKAGSCRVSLRIKAWIILTKDLKDMRRVDQRNFIMLEQTLEMVVYVKNMIFPPFISDERSYIYKVMDL